ncbi:MAG: exodeoxyribonuclease I [Pseudomonadales bacterium]
MSTTFYWHDYETTGIDPARDRPIQFAGIRTDENLNICGAPLRLYCKLSADILPHPMASAVTGISPQHANSLGVSEREFISKIHSEMSQPGTCSVGYNSIRFDDEFTRYTLYRNFYDAYEREYKNGNSRWDLIDVVRLCCALRPDDIEWPVGEDGRPSFRLELLSAANGIKHEDAHDALSDVLATIALAKIIKDRKPRLFDYALQLRNKRFVANLLDSTAAEPLLHVSSKLSSEYFCTTLVLPVAKHPTNSNGVICVDLRHDPSPLFELSAAELSQHLYMPANERGENSINVPLKTIHLNRSPIVATQKLLDDKAAERVKLDVALCQKHATALSKNTQWLNKLESVFAAPESNPSADVNTLLYGGGFFSHTDRKLMEKVRRSSAKELAETTFGFEDNRLPELLLRYQARNFPETLSEDQRQKWQSHCRHALLEGQGFGFDAFQQEMVELAAERPDEVALAGNLRDYAEVIHRELTAD